MSGTEQLLYLVGVPAAVVAVIWALASIGGPQSRKRYRPGRPYDFTPVWYLANHQEEDTVPALEAERPVVGGATGGASDRW